MGARICWGAVLLTAGIAAAQGAKPWTPPKTAWGDPDLQGIWTSTAMIGTPVQRPANLGDRTTITDEEFAQREARRKSEEEFDTAPVESSVTRCDPKKGGLGN